jgi:hypothetical protein
MAVDAKELTPIQALNSLQCILAETTFGFMQDIDVHLKDDPHFSFAYFGGGHNSVESKYVQQSLDVPLAAFLKSMDLSRSIFFLVSDHGLHFGPHLESLQGNL